MGGNTGTEGLATLVTLMMHQLPILVTLTPTAVIILMVRRLADTTVTVALSSSDTTEGTVSPSPV